MLTDEQRSEIHSEMKETIDLNEAMKALISFAPWKKYTEILTMQLEQRRNQFELEPIDSILAVTKQEYLKGEIHALRLVMQLPLDTIESTQAEIDAYLDKESEDD